MIPVDRRAPRARPGFVRPRRACAAIIPTSTGSRHARLEGAGGGGPAVQARGWRKEQQWALDMGLPGADCLTDKTHPDFRARRAAAFRRHQHVSQGALCRERPRRRQIRRRRDRHSVRFRHDLPSRHAFRAAGHPAYLGALHALQLRARRRSARADDAVRRRRRVHHPGQSGEELRPDFARRRACLLLRRAAGDARRRPFDRLSLRARHRAVHVEADRHHPLRPPHRHPGEGPRRADAHHARGTGRPICRTFRPIESRPARHRRLAGAARRRAGGEQARDQRADHRRHREAGTGKDGRDRARARLEGRRRGLHLVRRRLRSIAASCPAPAGPSPAAFCRARR